jgi:protein ImuB
MRRIVAVWLPTWPTDRIARRLARPEGARFGLALLAPGQGGVRLTALDGAAQAAGLEPGMTLATARALHPDLRVHPADPAGDARALAALAQWCRRFSPWVAVDGEDGLVLDATGCARLFGGEDQLIDRLLQSLRRFRLAARVGIADTPAAAWALARFGGGGVGDRAAAAPGGAAAALAPLPVAALRLPAATVAALVQLGLDRVGEVMALPRAPLLARFGDLVPRRLDEATGRAGAPIGALPEPRRWIARHGFTEPIARLDILQAVLDRLLGRLIAELEAAGQGARRLALSLFRADGRVERVTVASHAPSCDAVHLSRLFALRLENLGVGLFDPETGRGIEAIALDLAETAPLMADQVAFAAPGRRARAPLAPVLDRLGARLGEGALIRLALAESHVPERAQAARPARDAMVAAASAAPPASARPPSLLAAPEAIEAIAALPDAPPVLFRWRGRLHRIARAEGPERIGAEWWRERGGADDFRDYYRVEDKDGARFWLYRRGPYAASGRASWFLHGLFA